MFIYTYRVGELSMPSDWAEELRARRKLYDDDRRKELSLAKAERVTLDNCAFVKWQEVVLAIHGAVTELNAGNADPKVLLQQEDEGAPARNCLTLIVQGIDSRIEFLRESHSLKVPDGAYVLAVVGNGEVVWKDNDGTSLTSGALAKLEVQKAYLPQE